MKCWTDTADWKEAMNEFVEEESDPPEPETGDDADNSTA